MGKNALTQRKKNRVEEAIERLTRMKPGENIYFPNKPGSGNPVIGIATVGMYALQSGKAFEAEYDDGGMKVRRLK